MIFQFAVDQRLQLVRCDRCRHDRAQGVGDQIDGVAVFQNVRILGKQRALRRRVDIGFDRDQSLLADFIEDAVEQHQGVHIILLAVVLIGEHAGQCADDGLDHLQGRGDEKTPGRRAEDDHQLRRLEEHGQIPVFHEVAADDRGEDYADPDDDEHAKPRLLPFLAEDFPLFFEDEADDLVADFIIDEDEFHGDLAAAAPRIH